ncbi:MAG TPA: hypothetical protein VFH14_07990 [Gemmatimonadaceae bacterium]|nr:hypothetical protein [Gemmatimonadaceae bacterium]
MTIAIKVKRILDMSRSMAGDLDGERFEHHRVDLGKPGALDFLTAASFDGVQDSRLFGSPGVVIHSDIPRA